MRTEPTVLYFIFPLASNIFKRKIVIHYQNLQYMSVCGNTWVPNERQNKFSPIINVNIDIQKVTNTRHLN
jgi:hypothetical protein